MKTLRTVQAPAILCTSVRVSPLPLHWSSSLTSNATSILWHKPNRHLHFYTSKRS